MKETRMKRIFEILSSKHDYFTGEYLSIKLEVSLKSVRNDIKKLNRIFSASGAKIESRPRYGYLFVVVNQLMFDRFLATQWYQYAFEDDFNSPEFRFSYLLRTLLLESGYIKLDDLSEALFISRTTLSEDIKNIREYIAKFNLKIDSKPHLGIQITGDELDRRKCIVISLDDDKINAQVFMEKSIDRPEVINQLKQIILKVLEQNNFEVPQISFQNLVLHFFVSLLRSDNSKIQFLNNKVILIQETEEFAIAQQIAHEIEQTFGVEFDENESVYIAIHLLSKRKSSVNQQQTITYEVDLLVLKVLNKVKELLHVDLINDLNLRVNLGLHIASLLERLKYDLQMRNPLLAGIKQDIFAYEAAAIVRKVFEEEIGVIISEDELGFISLHFSIAIQTSQSKQKQKKILVICGSGETIAQLMKLKLQAEFPTFIESIETRDGLRLQATDVRAYDLIVTSVPLSIDCDVPIVEVNAFLDHKDIESIKPLMNRKANPIIDKYFEKQFYLSGLSVCDRVDFFEKISQYIESTGVSTGNVLAELNLREKMATTELENLVAIPHPLNRVVNRTIILVAVLDKPILWFQKMVQLVVMLMISNDEISPPQEFYRLVSSIILDSGKVSRVLKTRSFSEFIQILEEDDKNGK